MTHHPDAESALEVATVELFAEFGWETVNAYGETFPGGILGRAHGGEVVRTARLRSALERLNPGLPPEAIDQAVEELARAGPVGVEPEAPQAAFVAILARITVQDTRGWFWHRGGYVPTPNRCVNRSKSWPQVIL